MSIVGVSGKTSYIGALDPRSQKAARRPAVAALHRQGFHDLCRPGSRPGVCARPARADRQRQRLCGHRDQRPDAHQRREPVAAGAGECRQLGQERVHLLDHRAQQQRSDLRPDHGAGRVRQCHFHAQHPVRRPLSVFGTCHRQARDGACQRYALRYRDPGRPDADDRRTQAGGSGTWRRANGTPRRDGAAADDDRHQCRRRRLGVRSQALLGEFDADRRDHHAADRCAAGCRRSISVASIRTMARR